MRVEKHGVARCCRSAWDGSGLLRGFWCGSAGSHGLPDTYLLRFDTYSKHAVRYNIHLVFGFLGSGLGFFLGGLGFGFLGLRYYDVFKVV